MLLVPRGGGQHDVGVQRRGTEVRDHMRSSLPGCASRQLTVAGRCLPAPCVLVAGVTQEELGARFADEDQAGSYASLVFGTLWWASGSRSRTGGDPRAAPGTYCAGPYRPRRLATQLGRTRPESVG